jgi:hypothetical protein
MTKLYRNKDHSRQTPRKSYLGPLEYEAGVAVTTRKMRRLERCRPTLWRTVKFQRRSLLHIPRTRVIAVTDVVKGEGVIIVYDACTHIQIMGMTSSSSHLTQTYFTIPYADINKRGQLKVAYSLNPLGAWMFVSCVYMLYCPV